MKGVIMLIDFEKLDYITFQEPNGIWGAKLIDFKNFIESPSGFGWSEESAVDDLRWNYENWKGDK